MRYKVEPLKAIANQFSLGTPLESDPLLKAEEIARKLGVSPRTFARWLRSGDFPGADLRVGRVIRWRASTLDKWVAERGKLSSA